MFKVLFTDVHVAEVRLSTLFNQTNSERNWNVDYRPHPESRDE
jgi:hypothetical protein